MISRAAFVTVAVFLSTGVVAEILARRLRLPLARILVPLVLTAGASSFGLAVVVPTIVKHLLAGILGVYFGLRFDRGTVVGIGRLLAPSALIVSWYLLLSPVFGLALSRLSGLDPTTALLAVIPGGVGENNVLAMAYGADVSAVTTFQTARFLSIVAYMPFLARLLSSGKTATTADSSIVTPIESGFPRWLLFFAAGGTGAVLLSAVGFPAAPLIGALLGSAGATLIWPDRLGTPPAGFYHIGQSGIGVVIGAAFTADSLQTIAALSGSVLLFTGLVFLTSLLLALVCRKLFGWTLLTALLAVVPGGLTVMLILTEQLREDLTIVSTIQTIRLLTAVLLAPFAYSWFL